jgi:hypothetical protein
VGTQRITQGQSSVARIWQWVKRAEDTIWN